jgi:hypothetical protein
MTPLAFDPTASHGRFDGRILFGRSERPLLVPKGNDDFVQEAIQLFVQSGVRRGLATLMLKIDRWLPQLRLLPTVKSMPLPLPEIYAELGISQERLALYYGSPGPLRKLTIYSSSADRSVIKVALQPPADEMISNERKFLALLAEHRIGVDFVPTLLGHGQLSSGRRFVRTSVLPSGRRESRFGPMHRSFLTELYAHRSDVNGWARGRSYRSLQTQFAAIRNQLDDASCALLDAVLGDIAVLSGSEPVAECIVHGDFAPWNIAVTNDRLWVFDWENAVKRGNPLHDFLHFHLISEALLRRVQRSAALKLLLDNASRHLASVAGPGYAPAPALVAALTLHYLAEVVIFFCSADGTLRHSHPVIKSYVRLMQIRHSWLPSAP